MAEDQASAEIRQRHRIDFVTNPAWGELLRQLDDMRHQEQERLYASALGMESEHVQQHAGVVKGIVTVMDRLRRWREEILGPERRTDG